MPVKAGVDLVPGLLSFSRLLRIERHARAEQASTSRRCQSRIRSACWWCSMLLRGPTSKRRVQVQKLVWSSLHILHVIIDACVLRLVLLPVCCARAVAREHRLA